LIRNIFFFSLQTFISFNKLTKLCGGHTVGVFGRILHFNLLGIPALLKPACFGCARDAFWLLGIKKTYRAGSIWIARNTAMSGIVLTGATLSLLGIIGLMLCIARVVKAKKRSLSDEEMRAELAAVMPINLGSLFLSAVGLMTVAIGIAVG
jgi:hypothetical protein